MPRLLAAPLPILVLLLLALPQPAARAGETPAPRPKHGHADLVVDRPSHDFGTVKQNAVRTTEFTYTNTSDRPVRGIAARGECGCSVVELSAKELAPGASGVMKVEFNTLTLDGHLTKRIHLFTSDPARGEITIPLKIAIVEGLVVGSPGISFGDVALGAKPSKSFSLRWYEGIGKPFEIEEIDAPEGFRFVKRPYRHPKDPRWKGWSIELTLERELPLGMYSGEVLVRTTHPERPRLTLALSANVCGKIWLQSRSLSFGTFRQGRVKSSSLKFRPFDETVTFGEVAAKSRSGRIHVEVKPDPFMADRGYWKLIGTVPADVTPGSLDDEIIELHTGVPGEEVTLLKVRGHVRPARKSAHDR